jgi:hypothetical protein
MVLKPKQWDQQTLDLLRKHGIPFTLFSNNYPVNDAPMGSYEDIMSLYIQEPDMLSNLAVDVND